MAVLELELPRGDSEQTAAAVAKLASALEVLGAGRVRLRLLLEQVEAGEGGKPLSASGCPHLGQEEAKPLSASGSLHFEGAQEEAKPLSASGSGQTDRTSRQPHKPPADSLLPHFEQPASGADDRAKEVTRLVGELIDLAGSRKAAAAEVGVSGGSLGKWRKGQQRPTQKRLKALRRAVARLRNRGNVAAA